MATLHTRLKETLTKEGFTDVRNSEVVEFLKGLNKSAQFCSFSSVTERTDMNKYDAYFVEVEGKKKKNPNAIKNPFYENGVLNYAVKNNIVVGFDYKTSVEGRMERQGIEDPNFEGGESWHRVVSKALSVHKEDETRCYLRYQYLKDSNTLLEHYHKNDKIAYELFKKFVKETDHYGIQKRQGLSDENVLNIQVASIDNLLTLAINKHKFRLVENIERLLTA